MPLNPALPTLYCPVFYWPRLGRDWMWRTYYRSLRRRLPDFAGTRAVLAAWLYPDGVAAARLAMDLAAPCWIMVQGSDVFHLRYPRRLQALQRVADEVQGFICVSRPLAETLIRAGIHRAKVHVAPNGVDGTLFRYRTKREAAGEGWGGRVQGSGFREQGAVDTKTSHALADVLDAGRRVVLFVGNLVPVKGPDVFLESLAALKSAIGSPWPVVTLVIGDGPLRRGLERAARRLGLGGSVYFLGSRPHAEVARWMNLADVLCLTSRSEGMPNVVIEALVSGLPVVVTDVGACRELVEEEPLARWCLSEDRQALARALRELLVLSADRMSMAARHAPRYSWERQARRILEIMGR